MSSIIPHHTLIEKWRKFVSTVPCGFSWDHRCELRVLLIPLRVKVASGREGGKDNTGRPGQTTIQSNGSISETVRNRTHVHIKFLLRMTDTITSQNIDLSLWGTLYISYKFLKSIDCGCLRIYICVCMQKKNRLKKYNTVLLWNLFFT